jgi:hypothetical protein
MKRSRRGKIERRLEELHQKRAALRADIDIMYQAHPDLLERRRRELAQPISEAIREHDVHTVIASRSLRVLNPWAILANADSLRRVA